MEELTHQELTIALNSFSSSDMVTQNKTITKIYDTLYRLACRRAMSTSDSNLSSTVLVHETFIKLFSGEKTWTDRRHFCAVAATAMRQISIDYIRSSASQKRGGDYYAVTYSEDVIHAEEKNDAILRVNEMLEELSVIDPQLTTLIELKFFIGLTNAEVAESTGKSLRTVNRQWDKAKQLLKEVY